MMNAAICRRIEVYRMCIALESSARCCFRIPHQVRGLQVLTVPTLNVCAYLFVFVRHTVLVVRLVVLCHSISF